MLHAGGKFGGSGYAVSGGLHGVGVSVVNALSQRLAVEIRGRGPNVWQQTYTMGVPDAPLAKGEASDETGTTVTFWANADIFETTEYDFETLSKRFQQMAFLNKGLHHHAHRRAPGSRGHLRRRPRRRLGAAAHGHLHVRRRPGRLRQAPELVQEDRRRSTPR